MTKTTVISVVKASRDGATCNINGERKLVGWKVLRDAAKQTDPELRATYADVLEESLRLAKLERTMEVRIINRTNTPHGYCAELYDVAGEFVSGQIVAADFGLDGTYDASVRDGERAKEYLSSRGYNVTIAK